MSRTLNKVMLIGNVGKEPELKYTPSGVPVTSFRLATSETWKDREGKVCEQTDWHTIVAWRGLAEVIDRLVSKGSRIYIEGRLQTRSFDDKNNIKRHIVEILAESMLLLDAKRERHERRFDSDKFHSSDLGSSEFDTDFDSSLDDDNYFNYSGSNQDSETQF